jgi:Kef-type K+ transport system membrane component KefB
MHDLSILAIIWASVFVAAYLADKTRLTPVLWYLFCGTVLINIDFLPREMPIFINDFADLGIIIIMFALGFEEETDNFIGSIKRSWGIALFGAIVPFAIAYFFTLYFWHDENIALMCALAMTATAVSLTMVSLKGEGLSGTPAATGIMTSAVLDDIGSLALVAIMVPIATGEATASVAGIAWVLGKAIAFFVMVVIIGNWLFPASQGLLAKIPILGQINLRRFLSMGKGEYTILFLLLIAVAVGLLAHEFGFHPAIGAYMAGLIVHREYFDFHQEQEIDFYQQAREIVDNVAFTWIGPVFFVTLGAKLIFDGDMLMSIIPEALMLFAALFIGQITSAGLAARFTGKFSWPDSLMIGFGMLGRAELAFVVMNIAFVQFQILSTEAFYTLMLTCFLLNISVPLTIRWWKVKYSSPGTGI